MADSEKLEALKRAYAEIMLNMAKELAARILASERRAAGLQQSLAAAKEEALAALLRLKAIMDSKVEEAEIQSMRHVKRIQELEFQLHEAEKIITSLKPELKLSHNESEHARENPDHPSITENTNGLAMSNNSNCQGKNEHPIALEIMSSDLEQVTTDDPCRLSQNSTETRSEKDIPLENSHSYKPDVASPITRSKETELYRNGCTQRIRALEQNLLTENVPSEPSDEQCTGLKNDLMFGMNLQDKKHESTEQRQLTGNCGQSNVKFLRRNSPRKVRTSCIYVKNHKGKTEHKPPDPGKKPSRTTKKIKPDISVNSKTSESNPDMQCNGRSVTRQSIGQQNLFDLVDKPPACPDTVTDDDGDDDGAVEKLLLLCNADPSNTLVSAEDRQIDDVGILREGPVKKVPDGTMSENVDSVGNVGSNKIAAPTSNSEPKDKIASVRDESVRFLKYTFRRKRKRESLDSMNESVAPEMSNSKRPTDKQNRQAKPQNPNLMTESPRSNRRLVQVARQLISLSAKRW